MFVFRVHEFITLKLEENKTVIYVAEEKFRQCSKLVLEIPIYQRADFDEIRSIDEVVKNQRKVLDTKNTISPEEEFWGHCSNLQTWVENDYDTRLLHSYLSFPLLKKLATLGDLKAREIIKEEIIERFEENYLPTIFYLLIENYLNIYLNEEEQATLFLESNKKLREKIRLTLKKDIKNRKTESDALFILKELIREYNDKNAKTILKRLILRLVRLEKKDDFNHLLKMEGFKSTLFDETELKSFLYNSPVFLTLIKKNTPFQNLYNSIYGKMKSCNKKQFLESMIFFTNNEGENSDSVLQALETILYFEKEKLN